MDGTQSIGAKIVALRKEKGCTQADLGAYLNISYQAVSKWERGESYPDFFTMAKIAQYFNVSLEYFADRQGEVAAAESVVQDDAPAQKMLGVCTICGRSVYEGEEWKTEPVLTCKKCHERQQSLMQLKEVVQKEIDNKKMAAGGAVLTERVETKGNGKSDKNMLGVCMKCGRSVYEGEEWELEPVLTCNKCKERHEAALRSAKEKMKERERWNNKRLRKKRNVGFWVGGIIAVLAMVLDTINIIRQGVSIWKEIGFVVLLGVMIFALVSQLIWGGAVRKCVMWGGALTGQPRAIFTIDPDFFIIIQIAWMIVKFIVYLFSTVIMFFVSFFLAPFTFIPALLRVNKGREVDYTSFYE